MHSKVNKLIKQSIIPAALVAGVIACNKALPVAEPIQTAAPSGQSITTTINGDANFTFLKAAITKAAANTSFGNNLNALLSDSTGVFTFFAPTDAAFQLAGFPNTAAVSAQRAGFLDTILRYHLIPGQKLTSDLIPQTFPNIQEPTALVLAAPSTAIPPGFRMSIFPSKRGSSLWANNIPITQADIAVSNGVVHKVAVLVAPPSTTIKGIIATDPANFSILSAAIARADSGQVGLNRLDSAINYPPANLTLFAPTNDAFRAMFPPGTPDANIIGALNTPSLFPAQTVRAIVAYHLLGSRAFSVNFSSTPALYNTLLVIPPSTAVPAVVTYTGASFTVKGVANATASNVTTRDKHAINGVVHVIDQVLRPQ
jgi:uncharacterized surface protein with fasciclin (FAS1) repeats